MRTVVNLPHLPSAEAQDAPASSAPGGDPPEPDSSASPIQPQAQSAHHHRYGRSRSSRSHAELEPMAASSSSPFVPLLLGGLALLGWLGFQAQQLFNERLALAAAHVSQQQTVDNAGKLRGSLDALAADTQRMADAGNPSAQLLVGELRKRGVTINSASASATPATPATR